MIWELDIESKDKKEVICFDRLELGFLGIWKTGVFDVILGDFFKIFMFVVYFGF